LVTEQPKDDNKKLERSESHPYKSKVTISKKRQQERDDELSKPKRVRQPCLPVIKKRGASCKIDTNNEICNTSIYPMEEAIPSKTPESEPEIRLTEFVPTKIFLKKDIKKECLKAVNHTVTTLSPTGKVMSNIKICSIKHSSNSSV
jgi:hypothetical protein